VGWTGLDIHFVSWVFLHAASKWTISGSCIEFACHYFDVPSSSSRSLLPATHTGINISGNRLSERYPLDRLYILPIHYGHAFGLAQPVTGWARRHRELDTKPREEGENYVAQGIFSYRTLNA